MPITQPAPSKITRPRPRDVLLRTRLFDVLQENRNTPCIWITGPPGAGKTTLAASYLQHHNLNNLWFQVDAGDADLASFFYYMGLAAKQAAPRRRKKLPLFTPAYALGLPTFTLRFFEQLYSWLKPPFVMVLDNYQTVPRDTPFQDVTCGVIEALPKGGHVLILSRQEPPPSLARIRANGLISVIDWESLRLTKDEIQEIGVQHRSEKLTGEYLRSLQAQTEGWVAGLILLLQDAWKRDVPQPGQEGRPPQAMFDYFAREVFQRRDTDTQSFLMRTALFPKTTARMARQLTGNTNAEEILTRLYQAHYFTEQHDHSETLYQFHPLFRSFLLDRLEETHTPVELAQYRHKAAGILESTQELEAAFELYRAAGDWAESTRLICQHAPILLSQGRSETLYRWVVSMPEAVVEQTPWLSYWLGASRMFFNFDEARASFERAFHTFRETGDRAGELLAWSGIVDTISIYWGDFRPLNHWIDVGEEIFQDDPEFPSPDIETRVLTSRCCALAFVRPEHPELPALADQVQQFILESTDPNYKLMAGGFLVFFYNGWMGNQSQNKILLDDLRAVGGTNQDAPQRIQLLAAEACAAWQIGDFPAAMQKVDAGLKLSEESGVLAFVNNLTMMGLFASLQQGDIESAERHMELGYARIPKTQYLYRASYTWIKAWIAWLRGSYEEALGILATSDELVRQYGPSPMPIALHGLGGSILNLHLGDLKAAQKRLREPKRIAREMGSSWIDIQCLFIEAQLALAEGREQACIEALAKAFPLCRQREQIGMVWWHAPSMSRLCAKALAHGIEVDFVRLFIEKTGLTPQDPDGTLEEWPWPVKISALGGFRLMRDGEPIEPTPRGQKKVLELVKALVTHGNNGMGMDPMAEALWPDAEADAAHSSLKTTVHRLRRLLGHPEAIQVADGRLWLDGRHCWCDIWAFEQMSAVDDVIDASSAARLEQAMGLYAGPLLGDGEEYPWAFVPRERLRERFLGIVMKLGHYREAEDTWEKAQSVYERGLDVDTLAEGFYQRLMVCHQQLGRRAEALSVYERCCLALDEEFGVPPSEETKAIAREIAG